MLTCDIAGKHCICNKIIWSLTATWPLDTHEFFIFHFALMLKNNPPSLLLSRMTTGFPGCLRSWCWSWSATLSSPSSTRWLRVMPSGSSNKGTWWRRPSDKGPRGTNIQEVTASAAAAARTMSTHDLPTNLTLHAQRLSARQSRLVSSVCVCLHFQICLHRYL